MTLGEGRRSRVLCESPEVFHLRSIPAEIIIKTKSVALSAGNEKSCGLSRAFTKKEDSVPFMFIFFQSFKFTVATLGGKSNPGKENSATEGKPLQK